MTTTYTNDFISLGTSVAGSVGRDQRARYSFDLDSVQTLRIFLDGLTMADAFLRVYDSMGRLIAFDDDSGGNNDAFIQRSFAAGHYTIEAASYCDHAPGTYLLSLTSTSQPVVSSLSTVINTNTGLTTSIQSGDGAVTRDNTLKLSGNLLATDSVSIYEGDTLLSTYSAGDSAWTLVGTAWSYTTSALTDGTHTLTARFAPTAGGTTVSRSVTATVDTQITGTLNTTVLTNTGSAASITDKGTTSDHTLGLTGTAESGSTVQIYDGTTLLGLAALSGTNWTYTTPTLTDGTHILSARFSDSAGNTLTSSSLSVSVTPEALPVIGLGDSVDGLLTTKTNRVSYGFDLSATQTLRMFLDGKTVYDAYLRVYDDNNNLVAANDDGGGNRDSLIERQFTAGHYTIEAASYKDKYTGTYALSVTSLTPVTTKPTVSTLSGTIGTDTGLTASIQSGARTRDNTLELAGIYVSGDSISIFDGSTLLSTYTSGASNNSTAWSVAGTSWRYTTSALADGVHTLKASVTPLGSSTAVSSTVTATVDTSTSGTLSSTILTDTGSVASITNNGVTKDSTLELRGTVTESGSTVQIYDGTTLLGTAAITEAASGGNWSYITPELSNGTHSLSAQVTDAVGNRWTSSNLDVTVDSPSISLGDTRTGSLTARTPSQPNSLARDRYGFDLDTTQTLRIFMDGKTLSDAYLRVYNSAGIQIASDDDSGGNSDALIQRQFTPGHYTIEAASYRDSFSGSYDLSVTSLTPVTPTSSTLSSTLATDTGLTTTIQSGGSTRDNTLKLSGGFTNSNAISIYDGSTLLSTYTSGGSSNSSAWTVSGSTWSYTTPALGDGTHTLKASFAPSQTGGTTVTRTVTASIDTAISGTLSSSLLTDTGSVASIASGDTTTDHTLGLTGTAESGATVEIYDGSTLLGAATLSGTNWSYTTPELADGTHTLSARVSDAVGNTLTSSSLTAIVATPSAFGVGSTVYGSLTTGQRVSYQFDLTSTKILRIFMDGITLSDAYMRILKNGINMYSDDNSGGNQDALVQQQFFPGRYTVEVAGGLHDEFDGRYSLQVADLSQTTPASSTSSTLSSTIGTDTGISTSITSGLSTKDTTLKLSGKFASGDTIQIYDGSTLLSTYSSTDTAWTGTVAGTNWNYTTPVLTQGLHVLKAMFSHTGSADVVNTVAVNVDTAIGLATLSATIGTNSGFTSIYVPSITDGGSTNDHTLYLSGMVEYGSTVQFFDGTTSLGFATIAGTGSSWIYTTPYLSTGAHTLKAHFTDAAGNSTDKSVSVTIEAEDLPVLAVPDDYSEAITTLGQRLRYDLNVTTAQNLTITMEGQSPLNAYLRIYDSSENLIAFDNDSAGNLNAEITRQFAVGHYVVEAAGYNDRSRGNYDLHVAVASSSSSVMGA